LRGEALAALGLL